MKTNHRAEKQGSQSARAKQSKSIRPPQRSTPAVIEEAGQGTPTPLTEHELRAHEEHLEQRRKQRNMQIVLHFPGLLAVHTERESLAPRATKPDEARAAQQKTKVYLVRVPE